VRILFLGFRMPCMLKSWVLSLLLNTLGLLVLLNFGWRMILLCFVKLFPLLMWFLGFLKANEEGVCKCVCKEFKVSQTFRENNNCIDKLANMNVDNKLEFFGTLLCLLALIWIFFIINTNFLCSTFRWCSFFLHRFVSFWVYWLYALKSWSNEVVPSSFDPTTLLDYSVWHLFLY